MSFLLGLKHIARSVLHRGQADADTREELEFHIAKQTDKYIAAGMSPVEARRRAMSELGGTERWREATSDVRRGRWLVECVTDARHALRSFARVRGFALPAIVSVGIGVAVGTTMFALADGAFMRALPFPGADRAMSVSLRMPVQGAPQPIDMVWSYPKYVMMRERQRVFSHMALHSPETLTLMTEDGAERISGEMAGADYFRILGVEPAKGRTFSNDEDRIGGSNAVAVISDALWRSRFGARADVPGSSVTIGAVKYTIIGIMPPGFGGLSSDAQIWIPVPAARSSAALAQVEAHNMSLIARRNDGTSIDAARTETERVGRDIDQAYPADFGDWGAVT